MKNCDSSVDYKEAFNYHVIYRSREIQRISQKLMRVVYMFIWLYDTDI